MKVTYNIRKLCTSANQRTRLAIIKNLNEKIVIFCTSINSHVRKMWIYIYIQLRRIIHLQLNNQNLLISVNVHYFLFQLLVKTEASSCKKIEGLAEINKTTMQVLSEINKTTIQVVHLQKKPGEYGKNTGARNLLTENDEGN